MDNLERVNCADKNCEPVKADTSEERAIIEIASQSFGSNDGLHRVVTFLNKSLKGRGLIFGLTRDRADKLRITVYEVIDNNVQAQ